MYWNSFFGPTRPKRVERCDLGGRGGADPAIGRCPALVDLEVIERRYKHWTTEVCGGPGSRVSPVWARADRGQLTSPQRGGRALEVRGRAWPICGFALTGDPGG
jgi:hypothetical protein